MVFGVSLRRDLSLSYYIILFIDVIGQQVVLFLGLGVEDYALAGNERDTTRRRAAPGSEAQDSSLAEYDEL